MVMEQKQQQYYGLIPLGMKIESTSKNQFTKSQISEMKSSLLHVEQ